MKKGLGVVFSLLAVTAVLFAGGGAEKKAAEAKKVTFIGVWGGQELSAMNELFTQFEKKSGIKVEYQGTRDIDAILTTRVQAGNPPDIAALPGPGKWIELAKAGKLVDLSTFMNVDMYRKEVGEGWVKLGTVGGKLVGTYLGASIKGLVWYDPRQLAAGKFSSFSTWDEMLKVCQGMINKGETPWAIGFESGPASGWPGTDWLENIFVRMYGPQKYVDWYEGRLSWTSPEMKAAWQAFGQVVGNPKMLYGGKNYVLATNFGQSVGPVWSTPPQAYFLQQASFIVSFIKDMYPTLQPVKDFRFFDFPSFNPQYSKSVEAGGNVIAMFNDTAAARELMKYINSAEAQAILAKQVGWLAPNKNVALSNYPDQLTQDAANILNKSQYVVFDASDMMPDQMNKAFWSAVLNFVDDPTKLDSILEGLEKVKQEAYKK